jgi:hypothetical protein
MSGYVTLLGAEDVQRAASQMREAAAEMSRAAGEITEAVRQLRIVLEARAEATLAEDESDTGVR